MTGFVVGAQVVKLRHHRSYSWKYQEGVSTITKVHKTGRFVLDDGSQQYKPWDDKTAYATGDSYSRCTVKLLTDEIRAEVEAEQKHRENVNFLQAFFKKIDWEDHDGVAQLAKVLKP